MNAEEVLGLAWVVVLGFIRTSTNRRIFTQPLEVEQALSIVDGWLECPSVRFVEPGPDHWHRVKGLLSAVGTAGNLTSDAHLAALALEHACELHSTDNDFARFPGVRWVNPLEESGGS